MGIVKKPNISNRVFWLLLLLIIAVSAVFMLHYPGASFWNDEMATIEWCNPNYSLLETLKLVLREDTSPPLFYLIANLWMKVSPYGTQWLLLICEVFTLVGILFTALAARELGREREREREREVTISRGCLPRFLWR